MRSLGERVNLLRKLAQIKYGPGAAILPPDVTRIHMDFGRAVKNGHMGSKKFWRECLPRLKYHNPSIPMIVNRRDQNDTPPRMTIYLRKDPNAAAPSAGAISQPASSSNNFSPAQPPSADERVAHIDMKDQHSSHILEFFMAETRAAAIRPSAEDVVEMQDVEALKRRGEADRQRVAARRREIKREEEMLKRARALGSAAENE